jgi:hypothetical protein
MAAGNTIGTKVRENISTMVLERLEATPIAGLGPLSQLRVAEAIALTELPACNTEGQWGPPVFRGRWCHLLRSGPKYVGHALTTLIGPTARDWMIEAIFCSSVAADVADCLSWISASRLPKGPIRMLVAPSHQVHALTISSVQRTRVVVAHLPRLNQTLERQRIYPWRDFLTELRRSGPVRGVDSSTPRPRRRKT